MLCAHVRLNRIAETSHYQCLSCGSELSLAPAPPSTDDPPPWVTAALKEVLPKIPESSKTNSIVQMAHAAHAVMQVATATDHPTARATLDLMLAQLGKLLIDAENAPTDTAH